MVLTAGKVTSATPWVSAAKLTILTSAGVATFSPPRGGLLRESLREVLAETYRVRDRRDRGIHRPDAWEEARVDDVEVVELVRLAVGVEHRRLRVGAEAARACLVRDSGE